MRDKLDGLSSLLRRLSRVPGLGFLQDHATSLTSLKHTIEGHISDVETKKQGLEEGGQILRESVRRKPRAGADPSSPKQGAASGDPSQGETADLEVGKKTVRDGKSKISAKPNGDLASQKKMLQQKLKR